MYSETSLNIALPQLSQEFGLDLSIVQWLVIGYMLAIGIILPFASILTKWFSARKLTLFALGSSLVGALMGGFAPVFELVLIGRSIQGIGTGIILPLMFSMVMEVVPPHRIGRAMGMSSLIIMFATAVGPTLSGILLGALSWRWIFFSFVLILVAGIAFASKFEIDPYDITKPHVDIVSAILSCVGFGGIVLGTGVSSLFGWLSAPTVASLAVGVLGVVAYALRQVSSSTPILDLSIFKSKGFTVGAICVMTNFGITLSSMYVLPQFYQNGMLIPAMIAGLLMLPGGAVNALMSMFAGSLFDKIGARVPAMLGFALSALAAILLANATPGTPVGYAIACHIMLMIGVPLAMSPCQTHALASLPHKLSTDGSTALNTLQQVLGAVCTAVATNLLASGQASYYASGGTDSAMAFAEGSHLGFLFAACLAIVGFAASFGFRAASKRDELAESAPESASAAGKHYSVAGADRSPLPARTQEQPLLENLMRRDVFTLPESSTALEALSLFAEKKISGAPVVDETGQLSGFISDGDIIGALSHQSPQFSGFYAVVVDSTHTAFEDKLQLLTGTTVGELATKRIQSVQVNDSLEKVCALLSYKHLKKAPVMKDGTMVGIINRSDITRYATECYKKEL